MKRIQFVILVLFIQVQCFAQDSEPESEKIKVLNFATFHLSGSNDANSSPVNIRNPEVKKNIDKVVEKLVEFNPTIICVEVPETSSQGVNEIYQEYKQDQNKKSNWTEEINAIAFEVGRLAGVENIYGIDSKLGFNYPKLMKMANGSDLIGSYIDKYSEDTQKFNEKGILKKFRILNSEDFKSEIINFYNTLAVMHTPGKYEGAEIISKFYKRNLMIYTNFYDVPKTKDDRILIILGGAHSAYLDLYLRNHPGFELTNPEEYVAP